MIRSLRPRTGVVLLAGALSASGCVAQNRLGLPVRLERASYTFAGEPLEWFAAVPPSATRPTPVVVFVEGDGGECQAFDEGFWRRFLVRSMGHFVLVRPRSLGNTFCERDRSRWAALDFDHRADELARIVPTVRRVHPEGPLVLLGHSAGAHVARRYVDTHAGVVAGLIDLSGGYDELAGVLEDIAAEEPEARADIAAFVRHARVAPPEEPLQGRTANFWHQMLFSGVRAAWLAERGPCLVVHGEDDHASVPFAGVERDARAVVEAGGSCRLVALPGVAHDTLGPSTWPLIDTWLAALDPTSTRGR